MLINGWAGSGGDAFPWAFQQLNLGPIIGERTSGDIGRPGNRPWADRWRLVSPFPMHDYMAPMENGLRKATASSLSIEVWDDPAQLAKA